MNKEKADFLFSLINQYGGKFVKADGEPCFVLSSGRHTRVKYNFKRVFQNAVPRAHFAEAFAEKFERSSLLHFVSVLVGPESTGPFLAELQHYPAFRKMRIALAKKEAPGEFLFDAKLQLDVSDDCLIIDDVATTGRTLCGLGKAVRNRSYESSESSSRRYPSFAGSAVIMSRLPEGVPYWIPEPYIPLLYDRENSIYAPDQCSCARPL
jgi:hypothetical protein